MAMLSLIGGVISAIGAIQQGAAAAAAGKYQAAVARNNKIIAEQSAVYERQAGQVEAQGALMKYGAAQGEAHAAQGASGVETESGSAKQVLQTTELMKILDEQTIRGNAERKAYGFEVQGTNYEAEARLREFEGKQAQIGSFFNAAGSIIGGLSSFAGSGGMSGFGGAGGSVAPKWSEMTTDDNLLYSSYGPYPSGPMPTARPRYYSSSNYIPQVSGFPG